MEQQEGYKYRVIGGKVIGRCNHDKFEYCHCRYALECPNCGYFILMNERNPGYICRECTERENDPDLIIYIENPFFNKVEPELTRN